MTLVGFVLTLALLIVLSAIFSGSETGVYSLSQPRLEAEAAHGSPTARVLANLVRRKSALLVALLVGNNLVLELATYLTESRVHSIAGLPEWGREIAVTVGLTPIVFFFGEVFPKDLFRRRPHQLLSVFAPLLWLMRAVTLPITLPLYAFSQWLERRLSLRDEDVARAFRRQEVLELLAEGTRAGTLAAPTEELARNVLVLRRTEVTKLSVPWERVATIDLDLPEEEVLERIRRSSHSRLPAIQRNDDGQTIVVGYLHQLDCLEGKDFRPEDATRPLPSFAPELTVNRALAQLRTTGQRIALVGPPEAPIGLVTLMDLLSVIAGQAAFRPLSATSQAG